MGNATPIEWTDATANFWRGCDKVSPGCSACYMFRDQRRYGRDPSVVVRCSDGTFHAPLKSRKWADRCAEIRETEHRRMRVFTCSWSDFFHEAADPWRADAWDVIRACPQYDWQILTKRPEFVVDRLPADWGDGWPHVWLGVSIENRRFVHRADELRALPAAVRFISAEPLLGPLVHDVCQRQGWENTWIGPGQWRDGYAGPALDLTGISWMISGGESGGRAGRRLVEKTAGGWEPTRAALAWVRDLRDACTVAGVQFLHKQWGGPRPESGGRELDGRTWDEFPVAVSV